MHLPNSAGQFGRLPLFWVAPFAQGCPSVLEPYIEQLLERLRYINQVCPADARPLKAQLRAAIAFIAVEHRGLLQAFAES